LKISFNRQQLDSQIKEMKKHMTKFFFSFYQQARDKVNAISMKEGNL